MSLLTLFSDKMYLGIFPNNVSLFAILYITANGLFVKTLNYIYTIKIQSSSDVFNVKSCIQYKYCTII